MTPQYGLNIHLGGIRWFGLDEKRTIERLFSLPIKRVRIPIPFDEVNPKKDKWDFSKRDWLIAEAIKHNLIIDLQMGIKTIGWPEVHAPQWLFEQFPDLHEKGIQIDHDPEVQRYVLAYLKKTSERYLKHKEIATIQVENEPFSKHLHVSNYRYISQECNKQEVTLVKSMDPYNRPFIQNIPFDTPEAIPYALRTADIIGLNIYNQYHLPLPEFAYWQWLQALSKTARVMHKKIFITEYQTAAWIDESKPSIPFSLEKFHEGLKQIEKLQPEAVFLWDVEQVLAKGTEEHKKLLTQILDNKYQTL